MARLTHALDEIWLRLMEDLERSQQHTETDLDTFLLHVEDRFGEATCNQYQRWLNEN